MKQLFSGSPGLVSGDRQLSEDVVRHLVDLIRRTPVVEWPFHHLVLIGPFSASLYAEMRAALPVDRYYRPLRHHDARLPDGRSARLQFPLVETNIDRLPLRQRAVWRAVSKALVDRRLWSALLTAFAQPLEALTGQKASSIRLRPYATLFRDLGGYKISIHPDSPRKAITTQFYLPGDSSQLHLGTLFHHRGEDGTFPIAVPMRFAPNTGYSFAVTPESFHSVNPMRPDDRPRDSLMLIISYDRGPVVEGFKAARSYIRGTWDRLRHADDEAPDSRRDASN